MEKRLKCTLLLSLKELSLRRVSVLLWNGPDVFTSISKFHLDNKFEENDTEVRATVKDKIKDKVLKLNLPESLTNEMMERIRPTALEIRKWMHSHGDYFLCPYDQRCPLDGTKLCWTSAGTINNRKTAEELVRCDVLENYERYCTACLYCLEDDIPLLLKELPGYMNGFYKRHKVTAPLLQYCWPYILKGELSELDYLLITPDRNPFTFYQCVFEYAAETGNKTAAEYFLLKLSDEEREDSLMRTAQRVLTTIENINPFEYLEKFPKEKFSRISFLLPLMKPEQQMKVFASRPIEVLFSFLDWPWPDLFLENAGLFWDLCPPSKYGDLLGMMYERYTKSDFYVPKLFQELFVQSPLDFKKCFVDEEPESNHESAISFLDLLFDSEDAETIGVIFRNLDAAGRSKLLFNKCVFEELFDLVIEGKWHVVKVCLREATPSKEDKKRLKGLFTNFLECNSTEEIDCGGHNSKRFFQLLDEPEASADNKNKRKLEECCPE